MGFSALPALAGGIVGSTFFGKKKKKADPPPSLVSGASISPQPTGSSLVGGAGKGIY